MTRDAHGAGSPFQGSQLWETYSIALGVARAGLERPFGPIECKEYGDACRLRT
jgi:hypothetical protein